MPFCKSVHIKLPLASLRGLEVVDTPGFNDPVVSREIRTNEILGRCDVILIVSPSGRLLTAEDMTLMGRISQKEGVHELYVVVSQTDMQLYASERRNCLNESLQVIQAKNAIRAEEVFQDYCKAEPGARDVFAQILEDADNRVVCVSGMASSIAQRAEQGKLLDPDQETALRLLRENYPNDFPNTADDAFGEMMIQLSGIELVRKILESARERKAEILERRKLQLSETKSGAIQNFSVDVINFGRNRVRDLENTDIDELKNEITHVEKMKETLTLEINHEFRDHRVGLPGAIRKELRSVLDNTYRAVEIAIDNSEGEESRTRTVNKSGFFSWIARGFGGGTEEQNYKVTIVATSRAARSLNQFVVNIADDIEDAFTEVREKWRKSVHQSIVRSYRNVVGDEGVNKNLVLRSLNSLVERLYLGEFELDRQVPSELRARGTLEGNEADEYLDAARNYMTELHRRINNSILTCIDNIEVCIPDDVAGEFYKELDERVELMNDQLTNMQETRFRFAELEKHFNEVAK